MSRTYFNRKTVKVITPPVASPISLEDMKKYLRVDDAADDDLIQSFIDAATESMKQYLKRSLITETLEFSMDGFGVSDSASDHKLDRLGPGVHTTSYPDVLGRGNEVDIPFLPIQSVTTVKTFNRSNTVSTFDSAKYELDEEGGRIYLNEGEIWPTDLRAREAVKIQYVSGYGNAGDDIPATIIQAIKAHVAAMYDCRCPCEMPDLCVRILAPYKLLDYLEWC